MSTAKVLTAHRLGYGFDVAEMDRQHDSLHAALCRWLGVPSYSLAIARGFVLSPELTQLADLEEDAVLYLQRLIRAHRIEVPAVQ